MRNVYAIWAVHPETEPIALRTELGSRPAAFLLLPVYQNKQPAARAALSVLLPAELGCKSSPCAVLPPRCWMQHPGTDGTGNRVHQQRRTTATSSSEPRFVQAAGPAVPSHPLGAKAADYKGCEAPPGRSHRVLTRNPTSSCPPGPSVTRRQSGDSWHLRVRSARGFALCSAM